MVVVSAPPWLVLPILSSMKAVAGYLGGQITQVAAWTRLSGAGWLVVSFPAVVTVIAAWTFIAVRRGGDATQRRC
jgi:hypothetical protein